jgi:hypothetical protein
MIMTDQLLQYYEDRNRAKLANFPDKTFITRTGIDVDNFFDPAIDTVQEVGTDIGRGVMHGANDGINEIVNALGLEGIAQKLEEILPLGTFDIAQPETLPGELAAGISRFTVGAVPAARLVGMLGVGNQMMRSAAWGAIADAITTPEDEQPIIVELTGGLEEMSADERESIMGVVISGLEKTDSDPELLNRLRSVPEGAIIGEGLGLLGRGIATIARSLK